MKVAYVVSSLKISMTFVVNEIEAHKQVGWQILPLVSCRPYQFVNLSEVMARWNKQAVFRPNMLIQAWAILKEIVTHPLYFYRVCSWLVCLLVYSPTEFIKAMYELAAACYFASRCRQFEAEHIHVHFASRSLSLGLMMGVLTGLPVSCTVHAFDIFTRSANSLRPRLAKCKFIAAISQFNIEYLGNTCGKSIADLCHVVHCGIDMEKFKSVSRNPQPGRMVCVARLERKKGIDAAIAACAKLKEENVDFLFQIIGNGSERKNLEKQICRLELEGHVPLLGTIANDQLVRFFSEACLFFMPCVKAQNGQMDGIPVAMMEAMACEVPVVSTRISGIPELVQHNISGLLVDKKDPDELANAVRTLLSNPDKIRRFGSAARLQIEQNFNINKTAAQLRQLIQGSARE